MPPLFEMQTRPYADVTAPNASTIGKTATLLGSLLAALDGEPSSFCCLAKDRKAKGHAPKSTLKCQHLTDWD